MSQELLTELANRMARLSREVAAFWFRHGLDLEHGGFHGTLNRSAQPCEPTHKGLIQQARQLWTWSMWFARRDASEPCAALAHSAYAFIRTHFLDEKSAEFVYQVERNGQLLDARKVLYAQGFAIYGLSEYARAFDSQEARDFALRCFLAIDARAHDAQHGGYDQVNDAPWMDAQTRKETNTHLHLLEALTTLHDVTQHAQVAERICELLELFTQRIYQYPGYFHMRFGRDFAPLGERVVSYGHDLETVWLLSAAANSVGYDAPGFRNLLTKVGNNANIWGFDAARGGYFEEGVPAGAVTKLEKVWWVQAEALPGLFTLYQLAPEAELLLRMNATLDLIERDLRQPDSGEWYWGALPNGHAGPRGTNLGEEWKTAYHTLRALVYTEDWIRALLTAAS